MMPFRVQGRALLFDLDGVLADSIPAVEAAWERWAAQHSIDAGLAAAAILGRRAIDVVALLAPQLDPEREAATVEALEDQELHRIHPIPGAPEFVARLPRSTWAVVTSGSRRIATSRLAQIGIADPPVLITAEDVERGKPDPEVYRCAAAVLGVPAAECIVFEDSAAGIAAGKSAGCRVVAIVARGEAPPFVDGAIRDYRTLRIERAGEERSFVVTNA